MTLSVLIGPNAFEEARAEVIMSLRRGLREREAPTRRAQKPTPFDSTTSFRPMTRMPGSRDGLRWASGVKH